MIAPVLAGLGALALMSNPPRRRRRRSKVRRNPGKVIVLTWSENDGIELTGRHVWRDGILRDEHRMVPKARALVFSSDTKELPRAKTYAASQGYRVRVMAGSEDVLQRARALEAKQPTMTNPRRRRRSKARRNPGFLGGGSKDSVLRFKDGFVLDMDQPFGIPIGMCGMVARLPKDKRRRVTALAKKYLSANGYSFFRHGVASYMDDRFAGRGAWYKRWSRKDGGGDFYYLRDTTLAAVKRKFKRDLVGATR